MSFRFPLRRALAGLTLAIAPMMMAQPAAAQFFWSPPDMSAPALTDETAAIALGLPGATPAEIKAGLAWNLRAALNVAALQCQFEPSLLTQSNYNVILLNHDDELKKSYDTLTRYFVRTAKTPKAGQLALDQFGTRTYSGFTTVAAQYGFCQTAASIAREAIFLPRGSFYQIAENRTRELRKSLIPSGEQRYPRGMLYARQAGTLPRFDDLCWDKKGNWVAKKCGAFQLSSIN